MKKTDLEKNKGLKIANSMKHAGARRGAGVPKGEQQGRKPDNGGGLLGKLLGKAVPPTKQER
ncbi:hypothetical protein [Cupriavidus sp. AU9028]|uniref:hypothetical protein n=1 Tax=Cupriavidus sp. AU9028 TaxID=2871157 RepID=UPI001C966513|nr:hypothetical protein [Cupriavidus sp. AU9028]MBY4896508.1 hypothetical protein [Cupriavidus sp. AU9028]